MLEQFIANGICSGSLYVIVALGFGLIYNSTNIFHFAHGAIYVAASYTFYYFLIILKLNPYLAFVSSLILAGIIGILINKLIYEPLNKTKFSPPALMISSFGIYLFIINLIALLFGNEIKVLNPGIEKTYSFGSIILTRIQILSFIISIIIILFFFSFKKSKLGKIVLAYSNNPKLIEVLGYNSNKIKSFIFGAGSVLAAISANLFALDVGIDPYVGMNALLISAASVIIGGVKIFDGAIIGGYLLGLIQSLVVWQFSAKWMNASTFILLILFLLVRPQGLLGIKLRIEEEQ